MDWWEFPVGQAIEGAYDIRPSDIDVSGEHPFIGCFGYGETEWFVAMFIRQCQQEGNRWLVLSDDEYQRLCAKHLLAGYHWLDDDHGPGDEQPFAPTPLAAGQFFLIDKGLMARGDDGTYRATERLIKFCRYRRPQR